MKRLTAALLLFVALPARADSKNFAIDHLQLALDGEFLATEGAGEVRAWSWRAQAAYVYSDAPLVADRAGARDLLVGGRSLVELGATVELGRRFGLGVALPVVMSESGTAVPMGAALGDLRIVPRVELVPGRRFGLAMVLELRAPTGDQARFLGEGGWVFEPRAAAELRLGVVRLGLNVGARVRAARQYLDLTVGDELFASLAVKVSPRPFIDLFGELHGDTALSSRFGSAQVSPVEALFGAGGGRWGARLSAAVGFGIVDGFGAPRVRALVTLAYSPPARHAPTSPPAPPAPIDHAPIAPPPSEPEPLPDHDDEDELPVELPEASSVTVLPGRIELADPIFFDTNRKRVRSRFHGELIELANVLGRSPELRVWVEGHADATGPERWNRTLSRARAEQVIAFLVAHGAERARLTALGFGEAQPLEAAPGHASARNRRVHFFTAPAPQAAIAGAGEVP